MEGQANQSEVAVLDPAFPPMEPSKPKILLNLLISIFLGTMLAVGFALLAEMLDRRIRVPEDLSLGLDLPVLGVIAAAKPQRKSWLKRFHRNRAMATA
jgi:capsular polysaccharide biosynthesis protein